MEFKKVLSVNAPIAEVWELVDDLEAVASCIPGVSDVSVSGDREFQCVLTQKVGAVTARFSLRTVIEELDPPRRVVAVSRGSDPKLGSDVKSRQTFEFSPIDDSQTRVDILAEYQVTGRIATFGQRILTAKAEQITGQTLDRISALLEERRSARAAE